MARPRTSAWIYPDWPQLHRLALAGLAALGLHLLILGLIKLPVARIAPPGPSMVLQWVDLPIVKPQAEPVDQMNKPARPETRRGKDAPINRENEVSSDKAIRASGATTKYSTVWRWLHEDAIRPWQHRCWIFPRDPQFQFKAGRILDLYERRWQGQALRDDEFVISTDEKTSIQARLRTHPSLPTEPGKSMRVEHEYARGGAWAYLAALDVHRAKVFGRCEATTGIAPFERLVEQVMSQAPYNTARRVFWVMDNGSSHRGEASVRRLTQVHPRLVPVHGPVHASWLNQIEIYFSIVQRKALRPNPGRNLRRRPV